jgi:hypothetical protein
MNIIGDYLDKIYDHVSYKKFYRDIFPVGSFQQKGVYERGKYNGIVVEITKDKLANGKPKILRYTVTDDLEALDKVTYNANFCLMSPISYVGKTRDSSNARFLYALAIDLDGIQTKAFYGRGIVPYGLENMFHQIDYMKILPNPTYIVSSGTGVHLYYVFKKPIPMFKNIVDQLTLLKNDLTHTLWHDSISSLVDKIQYEPVCQGFRVVGTITKNKNRAIAYKTGDKVTIEYLNRFVKEENRVTSFCYQSDLSLEDAKRLYPEWYQKRIVEGKPRGTWTFNRAVYDKWLARLPETNLGHRYWSVWVLAVTAMKCGIKREELEQDAFGVIDVLNAKDTKGDAPFTEDDVLAALEGYDSAWMTYPVEKMAWRADIPLVKTKRNGRKQALHLRLARSNRDILCEEENRRWTDGNSRKGCPNKQHPKKDMIIAYVKENPSATQREIAQALGISPTTVNKWLKTKNDL